MRKDDLIRMMRDMEKDRGDLYIFLIKKISDAVKMLYPDPYKYDLPSLTRAREEEGRCWRASAAPWAAWWSGSTQRLK